MSMDISNFYLNTPRPRPEFMKIPIALIPEEIVLQYKFNDKKDEHGFVFIEINKGMYGLPQAGLLTNQLLQQRLAQHGFYPVRHTHGYWKHITKPTTFVLVVNDFSVKYVNKSDADDLLPILQQWNTVKTDWSARLYCGITTEWDYVNRHVTLSMPGYIDTILKELKHPTPKKTQDSPHPHIPIQYGAALQLAEAPDDTQPLDPKDPAIQPSRIIGKLLYYARAVDSTLNVALSSLASEQNKPTIRTRKMLLHLLDYCATHPDARLRFHDSAMILHLYSDAGYNNESKARSRSGGHLYLGNHPLDTNLNNGAILNPTHVLKHVASSAADAEIGATFVSCRKAIPIRQALHDMGHPQPPTHVILDNTTTVGFANRNIKQRHTKTIDMRYYWLQDQEAQENFKFV